MFTMLPIVIRMEIKKAYNLIYASEEYIDAHDICPKIFLNFGIFHFLPTTVDQLST